MAEIPVTKKSGLPWWLWAILAAVVLLLLFLFLGGGEDELAGSDEAAGAGATLAAGEAEGGSAGLDPDVVTDLTTIEQGSAALAGRPVAIDDLSVGDMLGDRSFTVTDGSGATVLVVLDEAVPGPDTGDDGEVDVDAGQTVTIAGELREVADGRVNGEPIEGLPPGARLYVYAQEVQPRGQ